MKVDLEKRPFWTAVTKESENATTFPKGAPNHLGSLGIRGSFQKLALRQPRDQAAKKLSEPQRQRRGDDRRGEILNSQKEGGLSSGKMKRDAYTVFFRGNWRPVHDLQDNRQKRWHSKKMLGGMERCTLCRGNTTATIPDVGKMLQTSEHPGRGRVARAQMF